MTDAQAELLAFLKSQAAKGRVPSFEEMREWLGLASKSGVHRLLSSLEEQGKIRRNHNRARQIEVLPDRAAIKSISTGELIGELVERGFVAVPKRLLDKAAA
jgi:repressor LexA